jgi:hypothetical protein
VRFVLEQLCEEAPFEDVSDEAVASVDAQRVALVEPEHPDRQVGLRRLEQEVVVVGHQAIAMASPAQVVDDLRQVGKEPCAIEIVVDDRRTPHAARRDVVCRSGCQNELAWPLYVVTVTTSAEPRQCPSAFGAEK